MTFNKNADYIIAEIQKAGYEAYYVGGCVRDFYMGRAFDDIDITTSAKPDELEKILKADNIKYIETGLKHGTVTAVVGASQYEITTYRTDGEYSDSRHPDNVCFVGDIKEDLSRRDFTVNAIAYDPENNKTVDLFGGKEDINNKIIRAVGDPDRRFYEDALRIMRAVRFASALGFEIEEKTEAAIFKNKELLKNISGERIFKELSKLLSGDNVFETLMKYKEVLAVVIPELKATFDCKQNTVWHLYDVYTHTCKSVEQAQNDTAIRLTMLLHDIGKPYCKKTDENGTDHFKGHQKISAELAAPALKRLKISNALYDRIMLIIPIHDIHIGTDKKAVKKMLSKLKEQGIYDLIDVKRADKLAQNPEMTENELKNLDITKRVLGEILASGEPVKISDLNINGFDLMKIGFKGREVGERLDFLLDKVIDGEVENEKAALLDAAKNTKQL